MNENLIIVSTDGHAGMPHELWPEYLEERFHEFLPRLLEDNDIYPTAAYLLTAKNGSTSLPELQDAHRNEYQGLYDVVLRLADMDCEGTAAELLYFGDFRLGDLFHNVTGRRYSLDAWEAGARGWNRWAADTFGFATDRFLVAGATGPCLDMDRAVAQLHWNADHRFSGTYLPGHMRHAEMPPLYDEYWEPFWTACEERHLAVVVHAGFGSMWGEVFPQLERIVNDVAAAAGTREYDVLFQHADAVSEDSVNYWRNLVNHSVDARRPMWQLMLGGVFDRHPGLRLLLTEIRVDWIPATLRHLDSVFEQNRSDLPAKRMPSEYWQTNCLGGASFIHEVEVEMRHEIGIETMAFGRDYPHPEGTWPTTKDYLRVAFDGVPEQDTRLILGENVIRFLGLDRERLARIAKRIGPTVEEITCARSEVRPELVENFGNRSGYFKPSEGAEKIPFVDALLREDLAGVIG